MVLISLLLSSTIAIAADNSGPAPLTADEVVSRMIARDNERQGTLRGYTATRRYTLENQSHHKRAEMVVQMTCLEDSSKQFKTVGETGWWGARKHVFPRLLEAEVEASRPGSREQSRITPENYAFEMVGAESVDGRAVYVMAITPKTPNKYLLKGRVWIDPEEYAIIRIEGEPAKSPSFWVKKVHFVHEYAKRGGFWFPASDRSVTDARMFGRTEVTIEYFDYTLNRSVGSTTHEPVAGSLR
jgi:hypothetical protein